MIQKCYIPRRLAKYNTIQLPDNALHSSYTCIVTNDGKVIYTPYDPFKIVRDKK